MKKLLLIFGMILFTALPAFAAYDKPLPDPVSEARAVALGDQLRCVVCQSQSINDSEAAMAGDLRLLVREKIQAGWSDQQILNFARERYGDFILLKPPVQRNTALLWSSPLLFVLLAALAGKAYFRRRKIAKGGS